MSGVVSEAGGSRAGSRAGASQDFEINIASIIDAFTVLIAFMLVSASYLSIGILDAGVAAGGVAAATDTPPSVSVMVEIAGNQQLTLKVTGKATQTIKLEPIAGVMDLAKLSSELTTLKSKWSDLNAITLSADETVEYKSVVLGMEAIRKQIPAVLLGGF